MSREVHVQFAVKSVVIMKKTLEQLGHQYTESGKTLNIHRSYHNIAINTGTNQISFDDADGHMVNQIKQSYQVNWYKNEAIKEGTQLHEEQLANGQIVLNVIR